MKAVFKHLRQSLGEDTGACLVCQGTRIREGSLLAKVPPVGFLEVWPVRGVPIWGAG